ncbi:hypothetical protein PHYPSEUDO_014218 [Phytophthora pseudosyringae]|uniref:Uncharacterized protein n=1 Tax=Phytophthora pseudosyringae TaxID=221518 RepID=A0A8T1WHR9_9STRA|nr:hypothetical protein PHYPSEUDO_014218 [Phytophthora pseudosyringae]
MGTSLGTNSSPSCWTGHAARGEANRMQRLDTQHHERQRSIHRPATASEPSIEGTVGGASRGPLAKSERRRWRRRRKLLPPTALLRPAADCDASARGSSGSSLEVLGQLQRRAARVCGETGRAALNRVQCFAAQVFRRVSPTLAGCCVQGALERSAASFAAPGSCRRGQVSPLPLAVPAPFSVVGSWGNSRGKATCIAASDTRPGDTVLSMANSRDALQIVCTAPSLHCAQEPSLRSATRARRDSDPARLGKPPRCAERTAWLELPPQVGQPGHMRWPRCGCAADRAFVCSSRSSAAVYRQAEPPMPSHHWTMRQRGSTEAQTAAACPGLIAR